MSDINDLLCATIGARKDSIKGLRSRIKDLLAPIPVGVVLSDNDGEVCRIIRVHAGASKWGRRTHDLNVKSRGATIPPNGYLLCEFIDESDPMCTESRRYEPVLKLASGKDTRDAAVRLQAALAQYVEECTFETVANNNTLVPVASGPQPA